MTGKALSLLLLSDNATAAAAATPLLAREGRPAVVFDRLSALADNRLYRHCRYSADTLSALIFYIGTSADIANIGRYILISAEIASYRQI